MTECNITNYVTGLVVYDTKTVSDDRKVNAVEKKVDVFKKF